MKKKIALIILITALIDQITKFLVAVNMDVNTSVTLIKNVFNITYITNNGVAFGMFSNLSYVIILLSVVLLVVLTNELKKYFNSNLCVFSYALIVGGLLGNLIDRIIFGHVRDFIDIAFINFPVFNMSDIFITVGVIMLLIASYKLEVRYGKNKDKE